MSVAIDLYLWFGAHDGREFSSSDINISGCYLSIMPRVACVDSSWSVGQTGSVGKQYQVV